MCNQIRCISHEIRNQISICELYSQIIKKNLEKENIKNDSIDNALFCISKALKLINNNLLELKASDSYYPAIFNLSETLKNGINMSMVYIQDKDIEISLSCVENINVCIDENKFLACLVNIIKNAIESIEIKGKIKISTEVKSNIVNIKISNNGLPIKFEDQKNLFNTGFTTKKNGNGLGLGICLKNIKLMDGDIKLSKSDSKNTEFLISLPLMSN